ncbi:MAG TPA: glycosyltransferase family 1 protein [Candidatus Xenobia bacterium]|nr:glycosyltransferase family 1 protein [Candidatus Xenobia bacterium]
MRVAIDIRRVHDFGVGTYTRNLVRTLARLDTESQYLLLGRQPDWNELLPLPANFSLLEFQIDVDGLRHDARLDWLLRRHRAQLLHTPYLMAPWLIPCRHILTVHDTSEFFDVSANGFSLRELLLFYRTRSGLRRAWRVLSVSEATRRDLQSLFGLPPDRIEVIYNALDTRLEQRPSPEEIDRTLNRYSVQGPYLLYAGNVKPRKNIPRLIEAFALVKEELREHPEYSRLNLIIIGDELSKHPQLRRAVVQSRTQHHVRFLGFVPPQSLSVFYSRAAAFVFPSLHEGFGLPPLEAMALGAPVVAANTSALPEVLGDAAVYVNPENVFDISRGIQQVLLDADLRARLQARGPQHAQKFSWEKSVQRVLELYRSAVSSGVPAA